jgi:hypothetical protein
MVLHFFPIIAHGSGLLSTLGLMAVSAVGAAICFLTAVILAFDETEPARRRATRFLIAGAVCIGIAVISPWIAQTFGLP